MEGIKGDMLELILELNIWNLNDLHLKVLIFYFTLIYSCNAVENVYPCLIQPSFGIKHTCLYSKNIASSLSSCSSIDITDVVILATENRMLGEQVITKA